MKIVIFQNQHIVQIKELKKSGTFNGTVETHIGAEF